VRGTLVSTRYLNEWLAREVVRAISPSEALEKMVILQMSYYRHGVITFALMGTILGGNVDA
jgi:hypothetical protein